MTNTEKSYTLPACDRCGETHPAYPSHEGRYGEGQIYAVVCEADGLTDYYTGELVREVTAPGDEKQTIELDCPPGGIRANDLIGGVIKGTGLTLPKEIPFSFFGHMVWEFDVSREVWERDIQPIIKPRIEALYHAGQIRYGSW